jgi:hypothetical protein
MKKTFKLLAICKIIIIALVAIIGFSFVSCVDESIGGGGGGGGSGGHWLISKTTTYTVTDGIAGAISSETERNWISYRYRSETDYEGKYTSGSTTVHYIQKGQNYTNTSESATGINTITYLTDLATGLILEYKTISSGTITEYLYTIQLVSDTGSVKTYKQYVTSSSGSGSYSEYKFQNGKRIELKQYTSPGVLYSTQKYTYTNNSTQTSYYNSSDVFLFCSTDTTTNIRGKVNQTLSSVDYPSSPANNYSQTAEVLSDSDSAILIRVKTINASNVLILQTDFLYKKI